MSLSLPIDDLRDVLILLRVLKDLSDEQDVKARRRELAEECGCWRNMKKHEVRCVKG